MNFCEYCGSKLIAGLSFCHKCGAPTDGTSPGRESRRRLEYAGTILKCPNCGETLKSFEAICPTCGNEFHSAQEPAAVRAFIRELQEYDNRIAMGFTPLKGGFSSWNGFWQLVWIVINILTLGAPLVLYLTLPLLGLRGRRSFSPEEKRKEALIKNQPIPNDRASVLELLIFIKGQMAYLASEKFDRNTLHWAGIWGNKAEQIYDRAEIIDKGDTISTSAHDDIVKNWKTIKKSFFIRVSIALILVVTLIILTLSVGPLRFRSNPFKRVSEETSSWPETEVNSLLPKPNTEKGGVIVNDEERLEVTVYKLTEEYADYFDSYIRNGFKERFYVRNESGFLASNSPETGLAADCPGFNPMIIDVHNLVV